MKKLWILFFLMFLTSCQKPTYKLTLSSHLVVEDENINLDKIAKGSEITITINTPFHHEITSVMVNGTEKKEEVVGVNLKVLITTNTTVDVTFRALDEALSFENSEPSFTFDLDDFRLEHIRLVYDSIEGREIIPLKKEFLNDEDFLKLFTTGDYFININYKGFTLEALIKMRSTFTQTTAPSVILYSLKEVVDSKVIYTFYTIGSYVSYTLSINPNMNITPDVSYEGGVFGTNDKDSIYTIVHSFGEVRTGSHEVFKLEYMNKEVTYQYVKQLCEFLTFTTEIKQIEDVRYYQR